MLLIRTIYRTHRTDFNLFYDNFSLTKLSTLVAKVDLRELPMGSKSKTSCGLDRVEYPAFSIFEKVCKDGLSTIYPFKSKAFPDPHGWKFGKRYAPSYPAFGRMRSLLAIYDALSLQPRSVLEVAAGGGGLSATLAQNGCEVIANDLLAEDLKQVMKEYLSEGKVKIAGGNLFDLSLEILGQFDLVIACEVIEHVAHPRDLLRHLKTFLAPGGRLLLTTPNGDYFRNTLPTYSEIVDENELEARQFSPDADGHLFLLTPDELRETSASVGLHVEKLAAWGTPFMSGHCGLRGC